MKTFLPVTNDHKARVAKINATMTPMEVSSFLAIIEVAIAAAKACGVKQKEFTALIAECWEELG